MTDHSAIRSGQGEQTEPKPVKYNRIRTADRSEKEHREAYTLSGDDLEQLSEEYPLLAESTDYRIFGGPKPLLRGRFKRSFRRRFK